MTVAEARQLLGEDIKDLTDEEVILMISADSQLIDVLFTLYEQNRLTSETKGGKNGLNA